MITITNIAKVKLNELMTNNLGKALFLYIKGVVISGLGPSGMIFFIAPTGQFLLGFYLYNELFTVDKLISFILIWIAVIIYLRDLYQKK